MLSPTPGLVGPRARAVHTCAGQTNQMTEETKKSTDSQSHFVKIAGRPKEHFQFPIGNFQMTRETIRQLRGGRGDDGERTAAGTVPVTV